MNASTAEVPPLPLRHCYWVVPGLLLAGEHPGGPTRDKTKDRLKKLLAAGIESFVDLTKPTELDRYDTLLPFYVEYARKAIKDHGVPASRDQMVEILEHVANAMRAGRPVYVHCRAGIGRTGTVIGCLLVERGLSGDGALDELNRLWQQSKRSRTWAFVPETEAQTTYVREWQPAFKTVGFEMRSTAAAISGLGPMSATSPLGAGPRPTSGPLQGTGARPTADPLSATGHRQSTGPLPTADSRPATGPLATSGSRPATGSLPATGPLPTTGPLSAMASNDPGTGKQIRQGSKAASAFSGAGLAAAAAQARAAVEAGLAPLPPARNGGTSRSSPDVAPPSGREPPRRAIQDGAPARSPATGSGPARSGQDSAVGPGGEAASQPAARDQAPPSVVRDRAPPSATRDPAPRRPRAAAVDRGGPSSARAGRDPRSDASVGSQQDRHDLGSWDSPLEPLEVARRELASLEATLEMRATRDGPAPYESPSHEGVSDPRDPGSTQPVRAAQLPASREALRDSREAVPEEPESASRDSAARHPAAEAARRELESLQQATEQARRDLDSLRSAAQRTLSDGPGPQRSASDTPSPRRAPAAPSQTASPEADPPPSDVDPLLDQDTLIAARALRERFVGTLMGLAVGDAIAAATQFRRPGTFTPVGDMIGGGPFDLPRGAWSDDTAMALCLTESLLESDGFDARDQVQRYGRWQQDGYLSATGQCVGITANTARSLAIAKWRRVVFPGSHDPEQLDPEPLSRVAPIALYFLASLEATQTQAVDASRPTCQAPAVLEACRQLGRAFHAALSGQPKARILADLPAGTVGTESTAPTNTSASAALAAALWAFRSTDNFRDAVLRAANVGGNSDVVASVCGALAGAHYGFSAVPTSWCNGLMHKDLIEGYADRLLAHALVTLSN